jgi:hypothetical protein
MNTSYKIPPNAHPQKGATIGILYRISRLDHSSIQNRNIPEIETSRGPNLMTISEKIRHETRPEISGKVDCNISASHDPTHALRESTH